MGTTLTDCAALLRNEVLSIIPGTVNTQHGTASQNKKIKSGSDISKDEVYHLPQVADISIADSGHGHKVTFRSPVLRPRLMSSPPYWSLSQYPMTCLKFLIQRHHGRIHTVRQKEGQN